MGSRGAGWQGGNHLLNDQKIAKALLIKSPTRKHGRKRENSRGKKRRAEIKNLKMGNEQMILSSYLLMTSMAIASFTNRKVIFLAPINVFHLCRSFKKYMEIDKKKRYMENCMKG